MKNLHRVKSAFSMLELVFVIIVMGILATLALPRLERDTRQEAADTIISNLQYAQHLAINDFRHSHTDTRWQMSFWQFHIEGCSDEGVYLGVGSDRDYGGDISIYEAALDPANGLPMLWWNYKPCEDGGDGTVSQNIFLTKRFDVSEMVGTRGCSGRKRIFFDHLGRPHVSVNENTSPTYSSYMSTECVFEVRFHNSPNPLRIHVLPETGYAFLEEENNP